MKKKDKREDKEKKTEIRKDNRQIFPVRYFDEEADAFVLSDNSYMNLLEVIAKDRPNMQTDEIQYDVLSIARFYKLYKDDIKWITLNFPINTTKQQEAKKKMLESTNDPVRKKWLMRHIDELERLDKNITKREYYLMFFGKSKEEYMKNVTNILNYIGEGRDRIVTEMSKAKRIYILKKLNNMSSDIVIEEEEENV